MKHISEQYNQQLQELAETLVTPERYHAEQKLGQLVLSKFSEE